MVLIHHPSSGTAAQCHFLLAALAALELPAPVSNFRAIASPIETYSK
jgi:hypothetical protein